MLQTRSNCNLGDDLIWKPGQKREQLLTMAALAAESRAALCCIADAASIFQPGSAPTDQPVESAECCPCSLQSLCELNGVWQTIVGPQQHGPGRPTGIHISLDFRLYADAQQPPDNVYVASFGGMPWAFCGQAEACPMKALEGCQIAQCCAVLCTGRLPLS